MTVENADSAAKAIRRNGINENVVLEPTKPNTNCEIKPSAYAPPI